MRLIDFNFGEYDARREFLRTQKYFIQTFIDPISFSLPSLSNRKNYIIIGQKGAGKTACQLYLENTKTEAEGYLSGLISFYDDLTPEDYRAFSTTQRMNLVDINMEELKKIEAHYDFKEVWRRVLFLRVAKILSEASFTNSYIDFCVSSLAGTNSIVDGIKKSLKVEIKIPLSVFEARIKLDPSKLTSNEISVSDFNSVAEQLFISECRQYRLYFFIDELVISNLNTTSDEYKARICLIRDLVRVCCQFNDMCVRHDVDMHFICNLRPEIRTKLNEIDPEISKIMDGNDVFLNWDRDSLFEIMARKVVSGAPDGRFIDADDFFPKTITFGSHEQEFMSFLINNTWYKPRDIVRFLKAYAKINPQHEKITEQGAKDCLNEYARISAVELFEQISVKYSHKTIAGIRNGIRRRNYENADSLADALKQTIDGVDRLRLVDELYNVGVIGNVDTVNGKKRYFYSFRQEEHLDHEMPVLVHPGLLNFFNVRHR